MDPRAFMHLPPPPGWVPEGQGPQCFTCSPSLALRPARSRVSAIVGWPIGHHKHISDCIEFPQQPCDIMTLAPVLQRRKLRLKGVKQLSHEQTADKGWMQT